MLRRALLLAAALVVTLPAAAQVQRNFPQNALRGAIVFGNAPEITLNGQAARLAPGTRIHDLNNMLVVPSGLFGATYVVNYTVDTYSLVKEVWILTSTEAAVQPWPTTADQAQAWSFDPVAQVWTKP
jgi:hypothetical protein